MNYKVLIFDFDGTLADSFDFFLKAMQAAAARHGFANIRIDELETLRGMTSVELMRHFGIPAWKVPSISTTMRREMTRYASQVRLFPGVAEMLQSIKAAGLQTGIATSNSRESVKTVLGEAVAHVDHLQCGASLFGKHNKLVQIARAAKARPKEVLYVGDELRDADAAAAVKMDFAAVSWGYARPEVLQPRSVAGIFRTPQEVVEFALGGSVAPRDPVA